MKVGHYVKVSNYMYYAKVKQIQGSTLRLDNNIKIDKDKVINLDDQKTYDEIYKKIKNIDRPIHIKLKSRLKFNLSLHTASRILFPDGTVLELEAIDSNMNIVGYASFCAGNSEWVDEKKVFYSIKPDDYGASHIPLGYYKTVPYFKKFKSLKDSIEKMRSADIKHRMEIEEYEIL